MTPTVSLATYALVEGPASGADSDILAASSAWSATSNAPWLHTTSSGTGNGMVSFTFDANSGGARSGSLVVGGQTLTVTQAGSNYLPAKQAIILSQPASAVTVDTTGNVYFSDPVANAIEKWDPATGSVTALVSGHSPGAMAVDSAGNIYFSDYYDFEEWQAATQTITVLAPNSVKWPGGMAVDAQGNVYIADTGNAATERWNAATGTLQTLGWITSGKGPYDVALDVAGNRYESYYYGSYGFNNPQHWVGVGPNLVAGVAVDAEGDVYFAVPNANALEEWNARTETVSYIANLSGATDVAVDQAGNVYVAGVGGILLVPRAFVPGGTSEAAAAGSDQLPPVLPTTESLVGAVAPTSDQSWLTVGNISNGAIGFSFTQNDGWYRVGYLTVYGQQVAITQEGTRPAALGLNALVEGASSGIDSDIVNAPGGWTATANVPWLHTTSSGMGAGVAAFSFDTNTGFTRTGTLTIAGQTLTITQCGSSYMAANQVTTLASSGFSYPEGVTVDTAGNLYIADTGNGAIEEWNATTQTVTTLVSSGLSYPHDVTVDGMGNVYIADTNNSAIKEWNATTQTVSTLISSGLSYPHGVAVDTDGDIFIADSGNNALKEWNATTQTLTTLVSSGLSYPYGLAVDKAGNVYIADSGNAAIKEWNGTTRTLSTLISSGLSTYPYGVAVDAAGNVYIADSGNNTIKEWNAPTQTVTTLVSSGLNPIPFNGS